MSNDAPHPPKKQVSLRSAEKTVSWMIEKIQGDMRELQTRKKLLEKVKSALTQDTPFQALALVKEFELYADSTRIYHGKSCPMEGFLERELREVRQIAEEAARQALLRYPNELENACVSAGLHLDKTSRHPNYTFDKGFFELEVHYTGTATLSNSEKKCGEFSLDIATVIQMVKRHHDRVFNRAFDGEDFLRKLRNEYLAALNAEGLRDGAPISLRLIARNMSVPAELDRGWTRVKRRKKGQQLDEFVVDLSRLINAGFLEIEGRRLELQQADNPKQGMLLHDVPIPWYVGSVRFKEMQP